MFWRKLAVAAGMVTVAFLTTWGLFSLWPEAKASLSWQWRGIQFGTYGPIAVFMALLVLLRWLFWERFFPPGAVPLRGETPSVPSAPAPLPAGLGSSPAAEALREAHRFYLRGYQELAIEKYIEAERHAREEKAEKTRAHAREGIATSYALQGENSLARSYYEEARKLYQQEQNRLGEANVLRGLGELERTLGQNEAARRNYEEARKLFQQVGKGLGEANVLCGLGELERTLGQNEAARRNYEEARNLFQQVGDRLGEANVLRGLGLLLRAEGNPEQARSLLTEARDLYLRVGMREQASEAEQLLSDL